MPAKYCNKCGAFYKACDTHSRTIPQPELAEHSRITQQSAKKMAKTTDTENTQELTAKLNSMSLEERERLAMEEIEHLEQEQRVLDMQAKWDNLRRRREERRCRNRSIEDRSSSAHQDGNDDLTNEWVLALKPTTRYSSYGISKSRHRSRECRRRHSKSRSDSRSSSRSRRRRTKW